MNVAKTSTVYARMAPELKEQAEAILAELGISGSDGVGMFYRAVVRERGLPFSMRLQPSRLRDSATMTPEQLGAEIKLGYDEMLAGKGRPASEFFDEFLAERGNGVPR